MMAYQAPALLAGSHLETIYPALFRKVNGIAYERERITTPDHDFLDLDWLKQGAAKLVIISHGLEGNSDRAYVRGMARIFYQHGYDALAWNYRGCSGEINRKIRFYHSGATDDLDFIVRHAASFGYTEINLVGFSLGGNLTLKYLGEKSETLHSTIQKAVAFSVPLNLKTSCDKISMRSNWIYSQRFLKSLKKKVAEKANVFSEIDPTPLTRITSLLEFDDVYTAPLHGFKNALDYYEQSSSLRFLHRIKRPTLIVNAKNDPFLSPECYPVESQFPHLTFEYPTRGGHVGFALFNENGLYWSELRALHFIQQL
ncbi:MAG: alpha/beta fold hydrolase [Cyclobacteriaceae bacterium]|nr:alpha/beta fold hydrolase [Cyclobacteriaceae bacterium]